MLIPPPDGSLIVPQLQILRGSLINQVLDDGTVFGTDYDGRLGPLTHWIYSECGLFRGKNILDLASNAGHLPIEYVRAGAAHVEAVEGRKEFKTQWDSIKNRIPGIDPDKITWKCADVRDFKASSDYSVISCFGLVYHTELKVFRHLITPEVNLIIVESEIFKETKRVQEDIRDRTRALTSHKAEHLSMWDIDSAIANEFPGWQIERIWRRFKGDAKLDMEKKDPSFDGNMRGLWMLKR